MGIFTPVVLIVTKLLLNGGMCLPSDLHVSTGGRNVARVL
jgi:hypothetical protein